MKSLSISAASILLALTPFHAEAEEIVIHTLKILKNGGDLPMVLDRDFGVIILNFGTIQDPVPKYLLASRTDGKVRSFDSKETFLEAVRKIPHGKVLAKYVKCMSPLSYGLSEKDIVSWEELEDIAEQVGFRFEQGKVYCVCPGNDRRGGKPFLRNGILVDPG